jgi:hypothetical protein
MNAHVGCSQPIGDPHTVEPDGFDRARVGDRLQRVLPKNKDVPSPTGRDLTELVGAAQDLGRAERGTAQRVGLTHATLPQQYQLAVFAEADDAVRDPRVGPEAEADAGPVQQAGIPLGALEIRPQ